MTFTLPSWSKPRPRLGSLPPTVLERVLLFASDRASNTDREILACHCLPSASSAIPYRCGRTHLTIDAITKSLIRTSINSCPLDRNPGLGPWCCKQHLAHQPGKKRLVPALAMANRRLFKVYREMWIWVFCSEQCLGIAIRRLPFDCKRLLASVCLFEEELNWAEDDYNAVAKVGRSREAFEFECVIAKDEIVYVCKGVKRRVWKGREVRVKDMKIVKKRDGVEINSDEDRATSKGKGVKKGKRVGFVDGTDEGQGKWYTEYNGCPNHGIDNLYDLGGVQYDYWPPNAFGSAEYQGQPIEMDYQDPDDPESKVLTFEEWDRGIILANGLEAAVKRKSESPMIDEPNAKKRKEETTNGRRTGTDDKMIQGLREDLNKLWQQ